MERMVIAGKAKMVFRLIELKAKYEEMAKAREKQEKKDKKR